MSLLDQVIDGAIYSPPKILLYGYTGIGKTTFASWDHNSFIIDCDGSANNISRKRSPYLETWEQIQEWLKFIETADHPFTICVIDTLDWLFDRAIEEVCGSRDTKDTRAYRNTLNKANGGYGNGKQALHLFVNMNIIPQLNRIVNRGIPVVLTSHAHTTMLTDEEGITTEKVAPNIDPDFVDKFVCWADVVGFARTGQGGQRVVIVEDAPKAVVKNRYNMQPVLPLDWNTFITDLHKGMKAINNPQQTTKEEDNG